MDPANFLSLNVRVMLMSHILLDDHRRMLVDEYVSSERIMDVIFDYLYFMRKKYTSMKTFTRNNKLTPGKDTNDPLLYAILKEMS